MSSVRNTHSRTIGASPDDRANSLALLVDVDRVLEGAGAESIPVSGDLEAVDVGADPEPSSGAPLGLTRRWRLIAGVLKLLPDTLDNRL